MRIGICSPSALGVPRGNSVAVERLVHHLRRMGHTVEVFVPGRGQRPTGTFHIVHAFHARTGGGPGLTWARDLGVPLALTLTGTDINVDLEQGGRREEVLATLVQADAVVGLHEYQLDLARALSHLALGAAEVIAQGVEVGQDPYLFRSLNGFDEDDFVVLLPAGLRPVKAPHMALEAQRLRAIDQPLWELALVGPMLEEAYGLELLEKVQAAPHATYCGSVPHNRMGAVYSACDVLLNTSESEGICQAILEAQAMGLPVLARDIPGNRVLVDHGLDGLLFRDSADLAEQVCRLQREQGLRRTLVEGGLARAEGFPTAREEAEQYLALYHRLIG
ncbi:MAG: glycosyltransferase [Planctomycetota bacterium]